MATEDVPRLLSGAKAAGWFDLFLGLVVVAAPALGGAQGFALVSHVFVGLLVIGLALFDEASAKPEREGRRSVAVTEGIQALAGLWLFLYPFLFLRTIGLGFMGVTMFAGLALMASAGYATVASLWVRTERPGAGRRAL